jgi:hypothetical protein
LVAPVFSSFFGSLSFFFFRKKKKEMNEKIYIMYLKTQFTIFTQSNYFHSGEVRLHDKHQFIKGVKNNGQHKYSSKKLEKAFGSQRKCRTYRSGRKKITLDNR